MKRKELKFENKTYKVSNKLEAGKAYDHKGILYVVWGDASKVGTKPGIYIINGKAKIKHYLSDQLDDKKGDFFKNIIADKDKIVKGIQSPVLTKEEKNDIFMPPIGDDDNILVRIVKGILKKKQINIKVLTPKFKDQMEMNNFKRSLKLHEKMSIERFERWMEVLDCEWDVTYKCKK